MKRVLSIFMVALMLFSLAGFAIAEEDGVLNSNNESDSENADNSGPSDEVLEANSDDDESDNDSEEEVEVEVEDDDKDETEVEVEMEGRKIKIKAKGNLTEIRERFRDKNRLRFNATNLPENCERTGSAIKCEFENGTRVMTIIAGNSGNTIIQIKDLNASTMVTLYKDGDKLFGIFEDNETKEIILPDDALERIQNKTRFRLENESIELDERGKYIVEAKREARFLWIIKYHKKVREEVDAEADETD